MLTVFLRAAILYALMVLVLRAMGKRQMAGLQPFELATTIVIADLISTPMGEVSTPLLHGVLPVAALFVMQGIMSVLCVKFDKVRSILSGSPCVLVSKGVINERELAKLCIGVTDLIEGIRAAGIINPAECGTAVMESNGTITAFPRSSCRPPTNAETGVDAGYEGLPMILIMDGNVQRANLTQTGKDEAWLGGLLAEHGLEPTGVFFACVDTQGRMTIQPKNGGSFVARALDPGEVNW